MIKIDPLIIITATTAATKANIVGPVFFDQDSTCGAKEGFGISPEMETIRVVFQGASGRGKSGESRLFAQAHLGLGLLYISKFTWERLRQEF